MQNTMSRYSFRIPERGTSLGLQTSASFELWLLEVAVRGRELFENSWNDQATIDEQVMFLEMLEEIQLWEKTGCNNLLVERARNLVVRMKHERSFHQRALVVYRNILHMRYSRTGTNRSWQQRDGWIAGSLVPWSNTESSCPQSLMFDEKFDEALNVEFPDIDDDDSSISIEFCFRTSQGQPSRISCEPADKFNEVSGESLSIFIKPTVTGEVSRTPFDATPSMLSKIDYTTANYEDDDPTPALENRSTSYIQLCLGDEPPSQSVLTKTTVHNGSKELFIKDDADEKIDIVDVQVPQFLGTVPEWDFKSLILWTVDKVNYRAKSIADLRSKHNVLIEGTFRKRCWYQRWQRYYGFILDSGVMLYFQQGVFNKVADFRNCGHVSRKVEQQCCLNIEGLLVASKVTKWIIKFTSKKVCETWCEIILNIAKNATSEVSELHDSLLATECYI